MHGIDEDYEEESSSSTVGSSSEENDNKRVLRKRKLDLNKLSSNLSSPKICQFVYCGVQLRDGESLDWHYEGHLSQEIEKLGKLRVKKTNIPFIDWNNPSNVRKTALDKVRFRREARKALPVTSRINDNNRQPTKCPLCDLNLQESEFDGHFEVCLQTRSEKAQLNDSTSDVDDDGDDEVDVIFEEYTWAGQTRIRATSLLEGDLSENSGYSKIIKGNEDAILDIEGDESKTGPSQYSESDVILPSADTAEEETERTNLRNALLGPTSSKTNEEKEEEEEEVVDIESTEIDDLKRTIKKLNGENEDLRRSNMCNVCMDNYEKPLVSLECWHVHCEQCWMRALGAKKLCPQCKVIIQPEDLRKIYL